MTATAWSISRQIRGKEWDKNDTTSVNLNFQNIDKTISDNSMKISQILRESVVFASELGIKCDGTSDDTAVLTTLLASSNTHVIFPSGVCIFSSTITWTMDDLTWEGQGPVATKLKMNSGTSGGLVYGTNISASPRRGYLKNIGLTGPGSTGNGITIRGNDFTLIGVRLVNWNYGIYQDDSVISIVNTKILDCFIDSNLVGGIKSFGIGGQGSTAWDIERTRITSNGTTSSHYQVDVAGVYQFDFFANIIEPNGVMHGVNIGPSSSGVSVLNNYSENSDFKFGVLALDDVRGLVFMGNTMLGISPSTNTAVDFDSVNGLISGGNYFTATSSYAYTGTSIVNGQFGFDRINGGTLLNPSIGTGANLFYTNGTTITVKGVNLYVNKTSGGTVKKASDGSCWLESVDTSGNRVSASVPCPVP
jgi:hypothetical protein